MLMTLWNGTIENKPSIAYLQPVQLILRAGILFLVVVVVFVVVMMDRRTREIANCWGT